MPVYADRIDNIVGILEVTDLFTAVDLVQPVHHFMSSAHYVAETQALEDLMQQCEQKTPKWSWS